MTIIDYFQNLEHTISTALHEDIQQGDLTADLIPEDATTTATILTREESILCGRPWVDEVFRQLDETIQIEWHYEEGDLLPANTTFCTLKGSARSILTGERTALNLLQTLMATAFATYRYTSQLGDSHTKLLDTRKTLPGLRLAQKYAVACGGGKNHRIGLFDAILIKENHIMAAGGIAQAIHSAKTQHPDVTVEIEAENLEEVAMALDAGADIIMLDNFSVEQIRQAVTFVDGRAKLEVSGNVEIEHLPTLAQTGVDFISTGAITKHIRATDLSMRFQAIT